MKKKCTQRHAVRSHTNDNVYAVQEFDDGSFSCNCGAWIYARNPKPDCKHIQELMIPRAEPENPVVESWEHSEEHTVNLHRDGTYSCSCEAWKHYRENDCIHITMVREENKPEPEEDSWETMEVDGWSTW